MLYAASGEELNPKMIKSRSSAIIALKSKGFYPERRSADI